MYAVDVGVQFAVSILTFMEPLFYVHSAMQAYAPQQHLWARARADFSLLLF